MSDKVPVEAIKNAPMGPQSNEKATPNQDPLTGRDTKLDQHLGRVGNYIGGGPEKAGNIAYIVVVSSLILLVLGGLASAYAQSDKLSSVFDRVVTGAFGLITGAMGYLFGSSDKSKQ